MRYTEPVRRALLIGVVVVGCTEARQRGMRPRTMTAPVELPARAACLRAPYVPPEEGATFPAGWTARVLSRRMYLLTREGDREPDQEQWTRIATDLQQPVQGLDGWAGNGVSAARLIAHREDLPFLAYSLELQLCAARYDQVARVLDEALGRTDADGAQRLTVLVALQGALGPRCAAEDPLCEPYAVNSDGEPYRPDAEREVVLEHTGGGTCEQDGECEIRGCGNRCLPWSSPSFASTCEGYTLLEHPAVFCGCVHARCSFFTQ